jgi:hypothetical protein
MLLSVQGLYGFWVHVSDGKVSVYVPILWDVFAVVDLGLEGWTLLGMSLIPWALDQTLKPDGVCSVEQLGNP